MQEIVTGMRVIRAFAMESYESSRFNLINEKLYSESFRYRLNQTIGPSLVELTTSFIIAALIIYGGHQITGGNFTPGSFFTFLFTLVFIMSPLKQLATWYNLLFRTIGAGGRVFEIIDMKEEEDETCANLDPGKLSKFVEYKKVQFRYPGTDKLVLKNISLKVPVGSTVALVGQSGAGKSTFVDLLSRFYEPTEGGIFLDGINIRDMTLKTVRSKIAIVTQEIFLFNASVRENIAYGLTNISEEELFGAAKMAFADDFIQKLPEGYDTVIGERGMMLSGGQRQRVSIARALLKNPEILILDEATSALDTNSERLVQKALERLMKNRTTFVIAHRLSTIYQANTILVFHDGKIVEKGDHTSLLKKSGMYRQLYDMQFQG
jgi:ABC-type multidrug transport system fused ATPase/permease subunit